MDYEALAWAIQKLKAFGVANNTMENALMMDRLELMLQGPSFDMGDHADRP